MLESSCSHFISDLTFNNIKIHHVKICNVNPYIWKCIIIGQILYLLFSLSIVYYYLLVTLLKVNLLKLDNNNRTKKCVQVAPLLSTLGTYNYFIFMAWCIVSARLTHQNLWLGFSFILYFSKEINTWDLIVSSPEFRRWTELKNHIKV